MRQTLVVMSFAAGLASCGGGGGSGAEPQSVVRDYLLGVAEGDLDRAKSAWMTADVIAAHFDCPEGGKLNGDAARRDKDLGREIDKRAKRRVELVSVEKTTPGNVEEGAELGGCKAKSTTETVELQATLKVVREGKPDVLDTDPVRLAKVAGRWYLYSF